MRLPPDITRWMIAASLSAALGFACKNSIPGPSDKRKGGPDRDTAITDDGQTQTITSLQESVLKLTPTEGTTLQAGQKCTVSKGVTLRIRGAPAPAQAKHFRIVLASGNALPGCALSKEGTQLYVFGPHFGVEGVEPGKPDADVNKTPLGDFIYIMVGGVDITSSWCQERSVGTCPHIGVDLVGVPAEGLTKSYAMSNGIVEDIVDVGSCGWRVDFRDSAGALWGYLHRKKPGFQKGQRLYRGDLVGVWYGGSGGCVTGPHLHLERFEAGAHGGTAKGFTCAIRNQGRRNCHFDPITPLRSKRVIKSEAEMKSVATQSKGAAAKASAELSLAANGGGGEPVRSLIPLQFHCSSAQAKPAPVDESMAAAALSNATMDVLNARVRLRDYGVDDFVLAVTADLTSLPGVDAGNNCGDQDERECVVRWELHGKGSAGGWISLFDDQGMRNRPLEISSESDLCVNKSSADSFRLLVMTNKGRAFVNEGPFELENAEEGSR